MKLSYDELPSDIKNLMQRIAQAEILNTGGHNWNAFQNHIITCYGWDCLYMLVHLKAIQMMGYKQCPMSAQKYSVIDWISIIKLFNMYSAETITALAAYVVGGDND